MAKGLTEDLEHILFEARFNTDPTSRMACNLSVTIFELHLGVIHLVNSFSQSHTALLGRSMIESLVNLKCLADDKGFINQIHFDDAAQNKKIFSEYLEFLDSKDPEYKKTTKYLNHEQLIIDSHMANNIKEMSIKKRFKLAGIRELYTIYCTMCSSAHNNATAVYVRHSQSNSEVTFGKELDTEALKLALQTSITALICMLHLLPKFSNVDAGGINAILQKLSGNNQFTLAVDACFKS